MIGSRTLKRRVARHGFEFDFTAVPVGHDTIADHQTQARSRPDAFGGVERLEDVRLNFRRNAAAVVGDFHHHLVVIQKCGDADLPRSFDRVDGVIEQIRPHLVEFAAVGHDSWNRAIVLARDRDLLELVAQHRQRVLNPFVHVHLLHRRLVHVRIRFDGFDQLGNARRAPFHLVQQRIQRQARFQPTEGVTQRLTREASRRVPPVPHRSSRPSQMPAPVSTRRPRHVAPATSRPGPRGRYA